MKSVIASFNTTAVEMSGMSQRKTTDSDTPRFKRAPDSNIRNYSIC